MTHRSLILIYLTFSFFVMSLPAAEQTGILLVKDSSSAIILGKKYTDGKYNISNLLNGQITVQDSSHLIIDGDRSLKLGFISITVADSSIIKIHATSAQGHPMGNLIQDIIARDSSSVVLNNFGRSKTFGKMRLFAKDSSAIVVNEESEEYQNEVDVMPIGHLIAHDSARLTVNGWKNTVPEFIDGVIKAHDSQSRTIGVDTSSIMYKLTAIFSKNNQSQSNPTQQVSWFAWLKNLVMKNTTVVNAPITNIESDVSVTINSSSAVVKPKVSWMEWLKSWWK